MDRLRKDAQKAEVRAANMFGGTLISGSGSTIGRKADVQTADELIEVKYTTQKSYSVSPEALAPLVRSATMCDKRPVLSIEFDRGGAKSQFLTVLPTSEYLIMKQEAAKWLEIVRNEIG